MIYTKIQIILPAYICLFLVLVCPTFSSASIFDEILAGDIEHVLDKREIRKWNQKNKNLVSMENERMGCSGYKQDYLSKDCRFSSELSNNSNKYISHIVVNIMIFNKSTNTIVAESKETFSVSIVPTVTKSIIVFFNNNLFGEAYKQLGDNYSWNYELIGCIPKDMTFDYSDNYNWLE